MAGPYKSLVAVGCCWYVVGMDDEQHRHARAAFHNAVTLAESQSAFARLTGAKQQNISNWLKAGKLLPGEFVLAAERETGVSRHLLRPDIYPVEHSATPSNEASVRAGGASSHFDRAALLKRDAA